MKKLEDVPPPTLEEALKMLEEECVISYDVPFIRKEYRNLTATITAVCVMHGEFKTSITKLCKNSVCPCCRDILSQLRKDHGKEASLIYLRKDVTLLLVSMFLFCSKWHVKVVILLFFEIGDVNVYCE